MYFASINHVRSVFTLFRGVRNLPSGLIRHPTSSWHSPCARIQDPACCTKRDTSTHRQHMSEYHENGFTHTHHDLSKLLEQAGFTVVSRTNPADQHQGWIYARRDQIQ